VWNWDTQLGDVDQPANDLEMPEEAFAIFVQEGTTLSFSMFVQEGTTLSFSYRKEIFLFLDTTAMGQLASTRLTIIPFPPSAHL
jgi:hypothetical protein